jgi:iron complex outermembrane receptor protein
MRFANDLAKRRFRPLSGERGNSHLCRNARATRRKHLATPAFYLRRKPERPPSPDATKARTADLNISRTHGSGLAARLLTGCALAAFATAACAAAAPPTPDPASDNEIEEVVVEGKLTLPGQVIGDIAPEVTLSPREIRAYGAANVTDLLAALAPQLTSGQGNGGRPVVLINGGRVSGFNEIRDLPTEAIARVEILPEEVSLKYGYPAEQKVVNFVLRQRFKAWLAEASATAPTAGAGDTAAAHLGSLKILKGERLLLDAKATRTQPITEADRDVIGGDGAARTLQPRSNDVTLNGVWAKPLGNGVSATINGTFESTDSDSRLGLSPFATDALKRRSETEDGRLAAAANGALAGWQWSSTAEVERNVVRTNTDRATAAAAYTDTTRAASTEAQADIVVNRALWRLPAGQMATTLTARVSTLDFQSDALRAGISQSSDLTRSIGELRGNLDIPLLRPSPDLLGAFGKLSANLNLGYQHLSDFGDLRTIGYGLNWAPITPVRVLVSYSQTDQAPTVNQLGDPVTATPGARVFDLATGQAVEVTRVSGGNAGLDKGERDVFKFGVTYKPFDKTNLNFQADYVSSRVHDGIVAFPSASTEVEDAFPDRFVRNAAGVLVQVDARPVNFTLQSRDELRWGFTYSRNVGPQPTPEQIAAFRRRMAEAGGGPPDGPPPPGAMGGPPGGGPGGPGGGPGGPGGGGRGGGFGGFGGGPRGGVFQIGLYHTVAFKDEVTIRPGLPKLDLLDGGAIGAGGGSPRNQVDLQANYTRGGLGVAMNAKWQEGTRIDGATVTDNLDFSDLTTVNVRLFADLGLQPWARTHKWLRGARATLAVDNLFDAHQNVRSAAGVTPISYQPDLLDPVGRSVRLTVRKLFF